jgi:hypothetical protein
MTPALLAQAHAAAKYGYGAIRLRRKGDYALVEIERKGAFVEVIREHIDGNFCHIVEPVGIASKIETEETDAAGAAAEGRA